MARSRNNNNNNKKRRGKFARRPSGSAAAGAKSSHKSRRKNRLVVPTNYSTDYSRYKNATDRFINYMMDQCPESVRRGGGGGGGGGGEHHHHQQRRRSINSLLVAADWMRETNHKLTDPSILQDIQLAIRMRHRIANSVYGGGDDGHWFLIGVLIYCGTILKGLSPISVPEVSSSSPEEEEGEESEKEALWRENRYIVV